MASKSEHKPNNTEHSPKSKEIDYAVQPVDMGSTVPVDGPIEEMNDVSEARATPSGPDGCASDPDTSSVSEQQPLDSHFSSPKSSTQDGMSDTTLEDGEVREHILEDSSVSKIACTGDENEADKVEDVEPNANSISLKLAHQADATTSVQVETVGSDAETQPRPRDTEEATNPSNSTNVAANISVTEEDTDATAAKAHSVPPHLRSDAQPVATRQTSVQPPKASEVPRYADIPRAPRNLSTYNAQQTYRADGGHQEFARVNAQLMKTRNELEAERKKSVGMRKQVEEEIQRGMDKALASMTTDLLNKQFELLAHQAKVQAKERELQYREDKIEQLEIFLSEGQKYNYRQHNEEEGGLSMTEVIQEHNRRQAELTVRKEFADREHKLAMRLQSVHFREAALQRREQQYKAIMRNSFETEMREKTMLDMDEKLNQVADVEYNRGFGAGKVAGRAEAEGEAHQLGFLEGYHSCHLTQVSLSNFRHGRLARDSPELEFLYDPAHPHNLFTMGTKIGGLSLGKEKKPTANSVQREQIAVERKPVLEQDKAEEPVRKLPPPRLTFASELRGAQTMHNGQVVLANGSATPSPAPTPKSNAAGRVGEGVYEGRRIVQYDEVEGDNLIDLL